MAYVKLTPSDFITYTDNDGNVVRYFTAGYIVDDVLGQKYAEYWIEGDELAALPPDDTNPLPNARFVAINQLTKARALAVHAEWVAASVNLPPAPIVRSPGEMRQIAALIDYLASVSGSV